MGIPGGCLCVVYKQNADQEVGVNLDVNLVNDPFYLDMVINSILLIIIIIIF
jgi:hypothetical protein